MKTFKTDPESNFVELYKDTMLNQLENATFEDIPLFINGIKVTQEGIGMYLNIYQEIASNVVVIDVFNQDNSLQRKDRLVYDRKKDQWENLPEKHS